MTPLVSICLPNLNGRPFLAERVETILAQTLGDWELIVSDNCSDDGAWEFLQKFGSDPRVRLSQVPREGMYANWNRCVRQAQGRYVYVATADDTMLPACIERLAEGLEAHPECGLACCGVRCIDAAGADLGPAAGLATARGGVDFHRDYFGVLLDRRHVRFSPHDGLLCATGRNVYVSVTQLLIRRELFERIGLYGTEWGSAADFEWNMRAGLVANTLYVPEVLATWRRHGAQATGSEVTTALLATLRDMMAHALRRAQALGGPASLRGLSESRLAGLLDRQLYWRERAAGTSAGAALARLARRNPRLAWLRLSGQHRSAPAWVAEDYDWFRSELGGALPSPWWKAVDA